MISRCWLHIGTGKTGTTTIQHYLARNRDALLAQGYLYPRAPGSGNHHALTAFALEDGKIDETRKLLGILDADRLTRFRAEFAKRLAAEARASGASNLILSNEVLSARLRTPSEVRRIKSLCDRIAGSTKVVVYIRNQVDFLVGLYTTSVLEGNPREFGLEWARSADYAAMLARWSAEFGHENIVVRRYEKDDFPSADVRQDFARQLEIDATRLAGTRDLNRSLDAQSIAFLQLFNRHVPAALAKRIAPLRFAIAAVLGKRRGGAKFAASRDDASTIEDMFRAANEQVASEYFPSLASPLFSPPSCVGDTAVPIRPAEMFRIAATLVPLGIYWSVMWLVRQAGEARRSAASAA